VQAFIKAFAPHRGLVAGELIAGCNDIGLGDFVLFGRAHLAASIIFLRSSSKEASMLHDAGWSNVTAKRCWWWPWPTLKIPTPTNPREGKRESACGWRRLLPITEYLSYLYRS
jgi:hypothetical protein